MIENEVSISAGFAKALARAVDRAELRRVASIDASAWSSLPFDPVADAARTHISDAAVVLRDLRMTYGELDAAVDLAAGYLRDLGVGADSPVFLVVENDLPSLVAIHAVIRAGGVAMVAPSAAGRAQLMEIAGATAPTAAFGPAALLDTGFEPDGPRAGWRSTPSLLAHRDAEPLVAATRNPDAPAVVIFTSGTTSRPKGVIHSQNTLLACSRNYIKNAALRHEDRHFVVSPLASVTGLMQAVTVAPLMGSQVILEPTWQVEATASLLLETGATFFGGPDILLDRLLGELSNRGISEVPLEAIYLGGTMLDPRILERAESFGIVVMRAYGSSEAPISTASGRTEPKAQRLADDGAPLDGVEVRLGSVNDPRELCIRGPHLFLGYVDADDDRAAFDDGWFLTGDLAELTDGRVRIVGRTRDIVIRNGLKVPISEVEGYLHKVPGIVRAAGFAVEDPETTEHLAVALLTDGSPIEFEKLVATLQEAGLATWKLPEELIPWDGDFPENANGKVQRDKVKALSADRPRLLAPRLRA